MKTFFIAALVLASIVIVFATVALEPKSQGAGAVYGQESNAFGSSSHRMRDRMFNRATIIASIVFLISLAGIFALS